MLLFSLSLRLSGRFRQGASSFARPNFSERPASRPRMASAPYEKRPSWYPEKSLTRSPCFCIWPLVTLLVMEHPVAIPRSSHRLDIQQPWGEFRAGCHGNRTPLFCFQLRFFEMRRLGRHRCMGTVTSPSVYPQTKGIYHERHHGQVLCTLRRSGEER